MGASSATRPAIRRRKRNQHTTDLGMGDVVVFPDIYFDRKRTEIICLSISSFAIPDRRLFFLCSGRWRHDQRDNNTRDDRSAISVSDDREIVMLFITRPAGTVSGPPWRRVNWYESAQLKWRDPPLRWYTAGSKGKVKVNEIIENDPTEYPSFCFFFCQHQHP